MREGEYVSVCWGRKRGGGEQKEDNPVVAFSSIVCGVASLHVLPVYRGLAKHVGLE